MGQDPHPRRFWRDRTGSPRTRSIVVATGILAVVIAPIGIAATGDNLREGIRNGTATKETQVVANVNASGLSTGGYSTRQSNLSTSGGGAVYGCRSTAGGSAANPPKNPCVRANNLSSGLAFEFNTKSGDVIGALTAGTGGDSKRPFTTNATGVATGLNADRVDGQDASAIVASARAKAGLDADTIDGANASELRTRWLLIDETGQIEEQSGGFTILDRYSTNNNVYVDAGSSLAGHGLTATIAVQNKIDTGGDSAADPSFGGEVGVARCQTPAVECTPANAKTVNAFVVAPRNSDGSATAGTAGNPRKRVYIQITE